jgi:hypothetical protein
MTDVILVAVIVAFFVAAALLVRALGAVVADSADSGPEDLEDAVLAREHEAAGRQRERAS